MNRIINLPQATKTVTLPEIPVGQAFIGTFGIILRPGLYLRIYDYVVDLNNPSNTWGPFSEGFSPLTVPDYEPVDLDIRVTRRS